MSYKTGDTKKLRDQTYKLVVFKITSKDEFDRPRDCIMYADDTESIPIQNGTEFMLCFVPIELVAVHTKGKA